MRGTLVLAMMLAGTALLTSVIAQAPGTPPEMSPASVPAGVLAARPVAEAAAKDTPKPRTVSAKQAREADDAYIEGARQVDHRDLVSAIHNFERAVELNPADRDYLLALLATRESRLTELVQQSAKARLKGDTAHADALLEEARKLDPDNPVVAQHFGTKPTPPPTKPTNGEIPADQIASTLAGPIELDPTPGVHSFHLQADARTLLRNIYSAYGIAPAYDSSVSNGGAIQFDLDNVNFADATRVALQVTHTFAVPMQPKQVFLVKDSQENREQYVPQIEETVYLPGYSQEQMTDLANVARNVFDLKQVTASATGGFMLLRGDEDSLRLVNATYADMLDGGTDVLFDVNLYEVNTTKIRNVGATAPTGIQAFDLVNSAQSLISANQSLLSQAVANGLLTLNGTANQNELTELAFLIGAGVSGATQFTNLLGVIGTYDGLPLAGLSVATGTTFNLMLNSTDARMLDAMQLRCGNGVATTFRAGSRYPIETAQYSSGISSSLASQLSGLNVNGTSVSALLSKYLGSAQTTVPQFQYEDLGITLKLTPHVQHGSDINLAVDLKIEALGGTSLDSIPILNNRALTSQVSIPAGNSAMLAALVTRNELRSVDGLPGLSELPGFQGTDKDKEVDTDELLITITPHIVRPGAIHIASRRLAAVHTISAQ